MYSDMFAAQPAFSQACERNKAPILKELLVLLPQRGHVLEIGSGTGQHVVHFAPSCHGLSWQPSERLEHLAELNARIRLEGRQNILPAIHLDVEGVWPDRIFAAAYSSNTAHIMSWNAVCAMFAGVAERLPPSGVFALYGPFNVGGTYTAASNEEFDRQLRERDPVMGLREVEELEALAAEHRLRLETSIQLPANNQMLLFRSTRRG